MEVDKENYKKNFQNNFGSPLPIPPPENPLTPYPSYKMEASLYNNILPFLLFTRRSPLSEWFPVRQTKLSAPQRNSLFYVWFLILLVFFLSYSHVSRLFIFLNQKINDYLMKYELHVSIFKHIENRRL